MNRDLLRNPAARELEITVGASEHEHDERRLQRRELLKKSAAAGAAAWVAPTIVSSTAHASHGGTCPDDLCTYYYAFKIENGCDASIGNGGNCKSALCGAISSPIYIRCVAQNVTDVATGVGDNRRAQFSLPPGFSVVSVGHKQKSGCTSPGPTTTSFVHTTVNGDSCWKRYTIDGSEWSHLEVIVCGPTNLGTGTLYCP